MDMRCKERYVVEVIEAKGKYYTEGKDPETFLGTSRTGA